MNEPIGIGPRLMSGPSHITVLTGPEVVVRLSRQARSKGTTARVDEIRRPSSPRAAHPLSPSLVAGALGLALARWRCRF